MASQVTKRGPRPPQMNMTPLIDVTFQLILFFMLVNNIIAEELPPMVIPKLDNPQTVRQDEDIEKITVNLMSTHDAHHAQREQDRLTGDGGVGKIKLGSQDEWPNPGPGVDAIILKQITDKLVEYKTKAEAEGKTLQVDLRADASLHYTNVRDVLTAITGAEIGNINLVAHLPEGK